VKAPYKQPQGVPSSLWQQMWAAARHDLKLGLVQVATSRGQLVGENLPPLVGEVAGLGFDFSRNLVSAKSWGLLRKYSVARGAAKFWQAVADGEPVNKTENRAASHMSWRDPSSAPGQHEAFFSLLSFLGVTDAEGSPRFDRVLNVGIGGSEFGPNLLAQAQGGVEDLNQRYVSLSSISPAHLRQVLKTVDLERSAVVVSSKSFTTGETMRLARQLKSQFESQGLSWRDNFFAVTAEPQKALAWGFTPNHVLDMTKSVGGRYSVASPIGFSFALAYGLGAFASFRAGMKSVDEAVARDPGQSAPLSHALIWFWYRVFFNLQSVAVIPYVPQWRLLTGYLQQLLMESLGKSFDSQGHPANTPVGSVVLGEVGTNAQHSFMQYLQFSTTAVPADLIGALSFESDDDFADFQLANLFAQSQALLFGAGESTNELDPPGGRPSNLLLTRDDSLKSLGQVISFYEHSTLFQAALYDVNPFDQWGVEAGKKIAAELFGRIPTPSLKVALEFFGNGITGRFGS